MSLFEELKSLGVDIDGGLRRIMGNEKLYTKLLGRFVEMANSNVIPPDFDASDCTEAIEKAHAIKGTAGNLSITPLYEAYNEILTLLRTGRPEEARALLEKTVPIQKKILECIESHMQ